MENGFRFLSFKEYKNKQFEIFEAHIEASIIYDIPLIIHQRNSEEEIIKVLDKFKSDNLKLVFHCFTDQKLLEFCIENNYYISLSGIITLKCWFIKEIIVNASLDHLLIETDSPLAPVPMRVNLMNHLLLNLLVNFLLNFFQCLRKIF